MLSAPDSPGDNTEFGSFPDTFPVTPLPLKGGCRNAVQTSVQQWPCCSQNIA